jgi:hypothetical protein
VRLLLFTGQALDAASFALFFLVVPATILVRITETERNPIVATLFALGGFVAVVIVKVGVTSLVIWRDQRREHRPRKTAAFMLLAAASGYVGMAFNLVALRTVLG